jgi:pyrimidine deaminase RibD-like protein
VLDSIKIRPSDELLKKFAPLKFWDIAVKQAQRSPHNRHKTGCVITNAGFFTEFSTGCSHKHNGGLKINSIHAERHALRNYHNISGLAIIVTLTRVNNFANCSRPCYDCAIALQERMYSVCYAERTNDGGWAIRYVPFDLLTEGYLKPTKYA